MSGAGAGAAAAAAAAAAGAQPPRPQIAESYLARREREIREKAVEAFYAGQDDAEKLVADTTDLQGLPPAQQNPEAPRALSKEEWFWRIVLTFASVLDNRPRLFKKVAWRLAHSTRQL